MSTGVLQLLSIVEVNTFKPAVWSDDPPCGHQVASPFQTHYCTYIRVPKLLTLQDAATTRELRRVVCFQWFELWFKVLLVDVRAIGEDAGKSHESVKLLRRGIELFRLFDFFANGVEPIVRRELDCKPVVRGNSDAIPSHQLADLFEQQERLAVWQDSMSPGLTDTIDEYRWQAQSFLRHYRDFVEATLLISKDAKTSFDEWLHLSELLSLQGAVKAAWTEPGRAPTRLMQPEHVSADENMFVVVHQCFELWFRVLLDLMDRAIPLVLEGSISEASGLVRQAVRIQQLLVQQIQIPATMLPLDFLRFREQEIVEGGRVQRTGLSPASGTESYQFREIEIACGLKGDPTFGKYLEGSERLPIRLLTPRQEKRLNEPSLAEAFRIAVQRRGVRSLEELFSPANAPNPNADLEDLADGLIAFDEAFRLWRINHVSMVEKMIGGRSGTGFLGPEYLMETAGLKTQEKNRIFAEKQERPRFFPELWQVRSRLVSR